MRGLGGLTLVLLALLSGLIWAVVWGPLKWCFPDTTADQQHGPTRSCPHLSRRHGLWSPAKARRASNPPAAKRLPVFRRRVSPRPPNRLRCPLCRHRRLPRPEVPDSRRMLPSERWVPLFWMPSGNRARGPWPWTTAPGSRSCLQPEPPGHHDRDTRSKRPSRFRRDHGLLTGRVRGAGVAWAERRKRSRLSTCLPNCLT